MQKIIESFWLFINLCLTDEAVKGMWRVVLCKFCLVSDSICEKIDFSDESIDCLQLVIDNFFITWVDFVGCDGVTNYIHMLGSAQCLFSLENGETCPIMPIKGGSTATVP